MNWTNPTLASTKADVLTDLKARDVDAYTWAESPTNPPTGAKRWVSASNKIQEWNGSSWVDKVLALESGGTGASNASSARTALGLGSLATQNSNAISVSGGTISGLTSLGVSGNLTTTGILTTGSGPTTVTQSDGKVLETAIADGTLLARNAGNEAISGTWSFANTIIGSITGNAGTVTDGTYLSTAQTISGRKTFSSATSSDMAVAIGNLGSIEVYGNGVGAAMVAFHRPGAFAGYLGIDTDNVLKYGGWSLGANAYEILHLGNYNSYVPTLAGAGASGTWGINITGNAGTATTASTASAVAGTNITGGTLAAGVTASSLTSVGTLSGLTITDGSGATPSLRYSSNGAAGMYYNSSNPTIEFGSNFNDSSHRGIVRSVAGASGGRVDILVASTFAAIFQPGGASFGTGIFPSTNNAYDVGSSSFRWANIFLQNSPNVVSDINHKRNHGEIENPLAMIRKTETLIASWKNGPEHLRFPALSAQNVKEVWDEELNTEIVKVDKFGVHAMYYERMIPCLIAAVKELDAQVQRLSKD